MPDAWPGGCYLRLFLLLFLQGNSCKADLPIHARLPALSGRWSFELIVFDSQFDGIPTCGSSLPNTNSDNLYLADLSDDAYLNYVSGSFLNSTHPKKLKLDVDLTLRRSFQPLTAEGDARKLAPALLATNSRLSMLDSRGSAQAVPNWVGLSGPLDPKERESSRTIPYEAELRDHTSLSSSTAEERQNGNTSASAHSPFSLVLADGGWSPIYDQGFFIEMPSFGTLTALVRYMAEPDCVESSAPPDESETSDGETPCYRTDPTRTLIGWFKGPPATSVLGCFIGRQQGVEMRQAPISDHTLGPRGHGAEQAERFLSGVRRHGSGAASSSLWTAVNVNSSKATALLAMLSKTRPRHPAIRPEPDLCRRQPSSAAPTRVIESYSVGDPFLRPDLMSEADYAIVNQRQCGSCYALAATYALQKRLQLALNRVGFSGYQTDARISPNLVLSCSFFNQGCAGGYPALVHEWWTKFGAGIEECEGPYTESPLPCPLEAQEITSSHLSRRLPALKFVKTPPATSTSTANASTELMCPESRRVYVDHHGYVGGCYGCTTEEEMRREIMEHGPIVAALDAPASLVMYRDGIFDESPPAHHRACSLTEEQEGLHGWEFTNHAVVLVGFGVENINQDGRSIEVPYWIARNTWGADWGQHGYFKIRRKTNLGGIENQGSFADVDLSRGLPRRILTAAVPSF